MLIGRSPFKGTVKRKIAKVMVIYIKDANMSARVLDQPMLGSWTQRMLEVSPMKFLPLVITAAMGKFYFPRSLLIVATLVIIFLKGVWEVGPWQGQLMAIRGFRTPSVQQNYHPFMGISRFLLIFIADANDLRAVNSKFLVVPYRSIYNCIMGRPFSSILDVVASSVHLKSKYYNL